MSIFSFALLKKKKNKVTNVQCEQYNTEKYIVFCSLRILLSVYKIERKKFYFLISSYLHI